MASQGQSVDVTCTATGAPRPTVRWTFNGQNVTQFNQTVQLIQMRVRIMNESNFLSASVRDGYAISTLHIVNIQPSDEGVYMCIGSNTGSAVTTTSISEFTLLIEGIIRTEISSFI